MGRVCVLYVGNGKSENVCVCVCVCVCVYTCGCVAVTATLQGYLKAVKDGDEVVPVKIRERPEEMFGNIEDIFNLHSK